MDYREILGLMCPHGIEIGKPFGGIPNLTGLDVAAAVGMGHLSRGQSLLIMVKYCDERVHFKELWEHWYHAVISQGQKEGWRRLDGRPGKIPRYAYLAMYSLTEDLSALHCQVCEGHGELMIGEVVTDCPVCDKVGRMYPSGREIARQLEMDHKNFQRVWQKRLQWCRHELQVWDRHAIAEIEKHIHNRADSA